MARKFIFTGLIGCIVFAALSGCAGNIPVSGDGGLKATQTALAQNALAVKYSLQTQMALQVELYQLQTQVAQGTVVSGQAVDSTSTPVEPSQTPTPAPPTATAVLPTLTPSATALPCNMAQFVYDVSVPDGTALAPGTRFIKTWRLMNIGSCTWTTDYALVFVDGDRLSAPAGVVLPGDVRPGAVIDVSVDLQAPNQAGSYRGNWKLRDAAGVLFGLGRKNAPFYVDIKVDSSLRGDALDFVAAACQAQWTSGGGSLPCQGANNDSRGFVLRLEQPTFETGFISDEAGLLTYPQMVTDGVIRGKFPEVQVDLGDHFAAVLSCAYKAESCDVNFQLDYQIGGGSIQTLATWHKVYDGEFNLVDVDLSSLAGQSVSFILTVFANGSPAQDRAEWIAPHISER